MSSSKFKIYNHFSKFKGIYASRSNRMWKYIRDQEKQAFKKLIKDLNKPYCLDLGAGSGEYATIILANGSKKVDCVDWNNSFLSFISNTKITKINCDVENYNTNKKYNLILCLGIVEFLDDPKSCYKKIKSFLRPTGQVIILLPKNIFYAFIYSLYYRFKGIKIQFLYSKKNHIILSKLGFTFKKKADASIFSDFLVYM